MQDVGDSRMLEKLESIGAKTVARWFVNHADRASGEAITQLKLQKLVYYADAWFLANFDKPLIKEDFEAWAHGPVVPTLYAKYRSYGWNALPPETGVKVSEDLDGYLEAVFEEYGQYSAKKLEKMTHEETPWLEARGDLSPEAASSAKLSKVCMRNFYGSKIEKQPIQSI
jgi:uncharacterized phage-associated protein